MNSFGQWLGKSNGEEMLSSVLGAGITKDQARAAVTTFCILFNVEVDTRHWDELMLWIYNCYNSWFRTYDEMDSYMCELLV